MKRSANLVSAQANPRERVKPRSSGRSQSEPAAALVLAACTPATNVET